MAIGDSMRRVRFSIRAFPFLIGQTEANEVIVRMPLIGSETRAHGMLWSTSSVDKPVNNSL
jgi:hypothetical protein